jgi:hypothetical protein
MEQKKELPGEKQICSIALEEKKRALAGKAESLHCPWSGKKSYHGQS